MADSWAGGLVSVDRRCAQIRHLIAYPKAVICLRWLTRNIWANKRQKNTNILLYRCTIYSRLCHISAGLIFLFYFLREASLNTSIAILTTRVATRRDLECTLFQKSVRLRGIHCNLNSAFTMANATFQPFDSADPSGLCTHRTSQN